LRSGSKTCSKRIATLTDLEAPATRAKATALNGSALELHALAVAIEEVLDLGKALELRHRIFQAGSGWLD
jgi:hypothetical protein